MSDFKRYRPLHFTESRPYVPGETLPDGVEIADRDRDSGSPKAGDMIARSSANRAYLWLATQKEFESVFEPRALDGEAVGLASELRREAHRTTSGGVFLMSSALRRLVLAAATTLGDLTQERDGNPMETAPRDGSPIWAYDSKNDVECVMRWSEDSENGSFWPDGSDVPPEPSRWWPMSIADRRHGKPVSGAAMEDQDDAKQASEL